MGVDLGSVRIFCRVADTALPLNVKEVAVTRDKFYLVIVGALENAIVENPPVCIDIHPVGSIALSGANQFSPIAFEAKPELKSWWLNGRPLVPRFRSRFNGQVDAVGLRISVVLRGDATLL